MKKRFSILGGLLLFVVFSCQTSRLAKKPLATKRDTASKVKLFAKLTGKYQRAKNIRALKAGRLESAEGLDLRGADLRGFQFPGFNFRGADLSGAHLEKVNLQGADFSSAILDRAHLADANLSGAHLPDAKLRNADLYRARLEEVNLERARLDGANLSQSFVFKANMNGTVFEHATLVGANFLSCHGKKTRFSNADLSGAYMISMELPEAFFEKANMIRAKFHGNFPQGNFKGAIWRRTSFHSSNLEEGNFSKARTVTEDDDTFKMINKYVRELYDGVVEDHLKQLKLKGQDVSVIEASLKFKDQIRGVDFSKTNLRGALFDGVDLRESAFDHALLEGANFKYALFGEVSFIKTDFSKVILEQVEFNKVDFSGAILKNELKLNKVSFFDANLSKAELDTEVFKRGNEVSADDKTLWPEGGTLIKIRGANKETPLHIAPRR